VTAPSDPTPAQLLARLGQLDGAMSLLARGVADLAGFIARHDDRILAVQNRLTAVETHLEERYRIEKHLVPPTISHGDT